MAAFVWPAEPPARKRAPIASAPDVVPPLLAGWTEPDPLAFAEEEVAALGLYESRRPSALETYVAILPYC